MAKCESGIVNGSPKSQSIVLLSVCPFVIEGLQGNKVWLVK